MKTASLAGGFDMSIGNLFQSILNIFFGKKTGEDTAMTEKESNVIPIKPESEPDIEPDPSEDESPMAGFRGDLKWVHAREGHNGKPYWPGGESGVTLDPGMDVGHADPSLIEKLYGSILTDVQLEALGRVFGIKGERAKAALDNDATLSSIRIDREYADTIFPHAADPYWQAITSRFPTLLESNTPPAVQTVMLSLSYNRGAKNKGLEILRTALEGEDWVAVADLVGNMQQDHKLEGIRKRRRMEADLIRVGLNVA